MSRVAIADLSDDRGPPLYAVRLQARIDAPWTTLKAVKIGGFGRNSLNSADFFVLVEKNEIPAVRIDFYFSQWDYHDFESGHGFDSAMVWKEYVVVGAGQRIFFVGLKDSRIISYDVESYFGSMKATTDYLFATSAESLYCFNSDGTLKWHRNGLGIDGVVINSITDSEIHGDGEWDPPGGWHPFVLAIDSGQTI